MSDDESYVAFVTARWSTLYRTSYLLTGDRFRAEDLLQAALLKTYSSWRRVVRTSAPEAYVRKILVNTLISDQRRKSVRNEVARADVVAPTGAAFEDDVTERSLLWSHLRGLPPRQRAVVVLRYYEDMTERQIAEALGCSTGTVKSQASDALRSLRRTLSASDSSLPMNGET